MQVSAEIEGIGGGQVTAVELNPSIAAIYANLFPTDNLIIGDAHQYLLDHFSEFDFIWASPPCQSHSSFRQNIGVRFRGVKPEYPDMKLYQEILFLQANARCDWVVENVKPYYKPLINPTFELQRHLFWSNVYVPLKAFEIEKIRSAQIPDLQILHDVDLSSFTISNKRQVLRNCVHRDVGKYIFESITKTVAIQQELF